MLRSNNLLFRFAAGATAFVRIATAFSFGLALAGCETMLTPTPVMDAATLQNPADIKYSPSDEPVKSGIQRFYDGNFGLAQRYFQDAVESNPKDATAWVGLAASYDRLGRFDLADRSYVAAVKLVGRTPSILNNEGYSYMLRGDLKSARAKFDASLRLAPGNVTTINNLGLLDRSAVFVEHPAGQGPCGNGACNQ